MKKLLLVLPLALVVSVSAQNSKPSAATIRPLDSYPKVEMQQQAAALDSTAPATARRSTSDFALPEGTPVYMKLETPLSTRTNKAGDRFAGRVTQPVMLNQKTIIPVGAGLEGTVVRADQERRIHGTPAIDLRPETVTMPDGTRYTIVATIVDTNNPKEASVDDEGRIHGRGRDGSDWKETGIATGATASVVRWLAKTRDANLPAGTEIVMELSRPMQLSPSSAGQ
jgi:hypothetical protein